MSRYKKWISTLTSAQNYPDSWVPGTTLAGMTVRGIVHIAKGGDKVRIKLSNPLGFGNIKILGVTIGIQGENGNDIVPGTLRTVKWFGNEQTTIVQGSSVLSDSIKLKIPNNTNISISIYTDPSNNVLAPKHPLSFQDNYIGTGNGNFVNDVSGNNFIVDPNAVDFPEMGIQMTPLYYVSEIQVKLCSCYKTIVAIGDSITNGPFTTPNENKRWPNYLSRRMLLNKCKRTVVNQGLGGNLLQLNPSFRGAGPNLLSRYGREILQVKRVKYVIVLIGINDITNGATTNDLIQGYKNLLRNLKTVNKHLVIYGGTILPANILSPSEMIVRNEVNNWIKYESSYDGVIDFAKAMASPNDSNELNPIYNSGDGLHPNDLGTRRMANTVDMSLFGCCENRKI